MRRHGMTGLDAILSLQRIDLLAFTFRLYPLPLTTAFALYATASFTQYPFTCKYGVRARIQIASTKCSLSERDACCIPPPASFLHMPYSYYEKAHESMSRQLTKPSEIASDSSIIVPRSIKAEASVGVHAKTLALSCNFLRISCKLTITSHSAAPLSITLTHLFPSPSPSVIYLYMSMR